MKDTGGSEYSLLEFEVTRLLEEAEDLAAAGPELLCAISKSLGWVLGEIWLLDQDSCLLRRTSEWHAEDESIEEFVKVGEGIAVDIDKGLPGRMLMSDRPLLLPDLLAEPELIRKDMARRAGLKAGLGFPLTADGEVAGVIVLVGREPVKLDEQLEATLGAMGKSVGQLAATDRALQRNSAYYRAIVDNQCDIVALIGIDGTIHYENAAVTEVLGYSRRERIGKNVYDFIHPEDVPVALRSFQLGLQAPGSLQVLTVRARHKDGSWTFLEATGRIMVDVSGIQVAVVNSRVAAGGRGPDADSPLTGGAGMTERQLTVLRLAGAGMTNKKIAEELRVSPHTIKDNLRAAMRKLKCGNRTEAVLAATRRGLL